jgi:glutathione S-transferase
LRPVTRSAKPLLWHIRISHYSEKARWALDYKGIEHERRGPPPGSHMLVALWLTRGGQRTFPVLELDGRAIGDSTAIIAALEERWPEPRLYPSDPEERRRALELEEYFDEELGPEIRLLGWHEATLDRAALERIVERDVPAPLRGFRLARAATARYAGAFVRLRYGVKPAERAAAARERVTAALDRLESELQGREYLAGDSFSVADLTAAALFYPLVLPPEGPRLGEPPAAFERFREPLKARAGYRWVKEIFRRHRRPASQPASA